MALFDPASGEDPPISEARELLHRYERRISVRVERNSRGVNWEVSYAAESVGEAMAAMREVVTELEGRYGV